MLQILHVPPSLRQLYSMANNLRPHLLDVKQKTTRYCGLVHKEHYILRK